MTMSVSSMPSSLQVWRDSTSRKSHPDFKLEEGILSVLVETHTDLEFVLRWRLLVYSLCKPPKMWKGTWETT
jgi:hypothetical protein